MTSLRPNKEHSFLLRLLKTRITIRLDTDVLNWFRNQVHEAGGGNYQTLINEALRQYIQVQDDSLEETLRKVIREELQTLSQ